MNERLKITPEEADDQSKDAHWDKNNTKIYQFHKCTIRFFIIFLTKNFKKQKNKRN